METNCLIGYSILVVVIIGFIYVIWKMLGFRSVLIILGVVAAALGISLALTYAIELIQKCH